MYKPKSEITAYNSVTYCKCLREGLEENKDTDK